MGRDDDEKLGFIEEALRHRQVPASDPSGVPADAAAAPPPDDEPATPADEGPEPITGPTEPVTGPTLEPTPAVATPAVPFDTWPVDDRALVDEALKKAGLIWVRTTDRPQGHAYWHAWHDDRIYLLTGPGEQPGAGLVDGGELVVVVASKDNSARLLTFGALVGDVHPADDDWAAATAALASGRLNLPDPPGAPTRWAADDTVRVVRLTPSDPTGERPGAYGDASQRAAPHPSSATTVGAKPWVAHRRHGSGRTLS